MAIGRRVLLNDSARDKEMLWTKHRHVDPLVIARERRAPVVNEALKRSLDGSAMRNCVGEMVRPTVHVTCSNNQVFPPLLRHADQEPMGGQPHEQVGVSPEDVRATQGLPPDMIPVVHVVLPEEVMTISQLGRYCISGLRTRNVSLTS
jgi:hypothetical protein